MGLVNALPDTISVISEAEVSAQARGRVNTLAHGPQNINHVFMPWSNTQFSKLLKTELFPSYYNTTRDAMAKA